MDVDLIIKMGFFIRDLHNNIAELHAQQFAEHAPMSSFTVYRGQGLSQIQFDQMIKTNGGLLSFNNPLSTSLDREISLSFAQSNQIGSDLIGVLFKINVNPSVSSTPFANIRDISYFEGEEEILFSMHSVFRIETMKQINENNRLWQIDLTLTSDNDPELHELTESIRKDTCSDAEGWDRLGVLLIKLGQFNNAQEVYDTLLNQTTTYQEKAVIYHRLGVIKNNQGEYTDAMAYYQRSIEINKDVLSSMDANLARSYSNMGLVYDNIGDYSNALSYHQKALEIEQKTLPLTHPSLATSYNNIGLLYGNMGNFANALLSHQKALDIRHKILPSYHPDLATSYNSIGLVYNSIGDYSKALFYHQKATDICQRTLPSNHPDLATSYNNIGSVHDSMGDYSNALLYHQKALDLCQKTLPSNHPDLATSYKHIEIVSSKSEEHVKAVSYREQIL
ncbi:unnamed protein product [Rotaria sp. Silwood1]|nr:unnamed protein product [Rotaria sp. Silwood1]